MSSVSSVEVSVLGLASAMLVSPQFSRPADVEARVGCESFWNTSAWDAAIAAERFISDVAIDCILHVREECEMLEYIICCYLLILGST